MSGTDSVNKSEALESALKILDEIQAGGKKAPHKFEPVYLTLMNVAPASAKEAGELIAEGIKLCPELGKDHDALQSFRIHVLRNVINDQLGNNTSSIDEDNFCRNI